MMAFIDVVSLAVRVCVWYKLITYTNVSVKQRRRILDEYRDAGTPTAGSTGPTQPRPGPARRARDRRRRWHRGRDHGEDRGGRRCRADVPLPACEEQGGPARRPH